MFLIKEIVEVKIDYSDIFHKQNIVLALYSLYSHV